MKIFAVANQKGGVGKTTTSVNVCASLAATNRKVLLIDLDPQANATMGCGVDKRGLQRTVYHALLGLARLEEVMLPAAPGFDLVPANRDLAGAEIELIEVERREQRLCDSLRVLAQRYDFVFIDCPPALNLLTLNALVAADAVMIPMQCEYYALEGLSDLVNTVKRVRGGLNPRLEIGGLLRTMFDPRNTLSLQVSRELEKHFGGKVYRTVIPRNIRLAEAPSHGKAALQFDRASKGAQAYLTLAGELLNRAAAAA